MATDPKQTQNFSIYNGAKVGSMETSDYDLDSNSEAMVTDSGGVFTTGRTTTRISANTVVAVDGDTNALKKALVAGTVLTIQVGIVDGDTDAIKMIVKSAKYTTDVKNGSLKGSFEFIGFDPESS